MAAMTRRWWLATLGLAPVGAGLAALVGGREETQKTTRHVWRDIPARELIQRRHLPNVTLVTHQGKTVRFYEDLVKNKKVVINFVFTRCEGICVPVTHNMVRVQKLLGDRVGRDIFFYSITLKPQEDSIEALREFAAIHGVGPGWSFLTGKPEDVELLRTKLGFTYDDPVEDADKSNHIGMVRVGNEPYLRWSACQGQASAAWIATSILLEVDGPTRSGPRAASPADVAP